MRSPSPGSGLAPGDPDRRYPGVELPAGKALTHALDSAAGLRRYEAEGAFLPSIVRRGMVVPPFGQEVESPAL